MQICQSQSSVLIEKPTEIYDVKRLAAAIGVKPGTIRSMRSRGKLPEPFATDINGGAVWLAAAVEQFLNGTPISVVDTVSDPSLPAVLDLFSGCGGMSLGFQEAGFNVLAGYDNWGCAVKTYSANLGHDAFNLDLSNVDITLRELRPYFQDDRPAIIGGPPCQDFSSAGKRTEGSRADLTQKFATIVAELQPPFFVMENVARAERAVAFTQALDIFNSVGYYTSHLVLNASRCGVPQRRKRLFTFGAFDSEFADMLKKWLETHQSEREMSVRDWFGDRLDTDYYYRHPRSYARRAVFSTDEPSPTIRGVNRPIPLGYPGHKGDAATVDQARPLSTQERAEIQTFPNSFSFLGSKTDSEQMIGNAVPVRLAQYVARGIASYHHSRVAS